MVVGNAQLDTHKDNCRRNSLRRKLTLETKLTIDMKPLHRVLQQNHQLVEMRQWQTCTLWSE